MRDTTNSRTQLAGSRPRWTPP